MEYATNIPQTKMNGLFICGITTLTRDEWEGRRKCPRFSEPSEENQTNSAIHAMDGAVPIRVKSMDDRVEEMSVKLTDKVDRLREMVHTKFGMCVVFS